MVGVNSGPLDDDHTVAGVKIPLITEDMHVVVDTTAKAKEFTILEHKSTKKG